MNIIRLDNQSMMTFYCNCIIRLFYGKTKDVNLNETWDMSSDAMRIGSDLTDITSESNWTRDSDCDIAMT